MEETGLVAGTLLDPEAMRNQKATTHKAISAGTSSGFHEQLIRRAADILPRGSNAVDSKAKAVDTKKQPDRSQGRRPSREKEKDIDKGKKEKKKKKKKRQHGKKKKKKKDKKRKKKRRVTLSDGRIVSCSSSSSASSRTRKLWRHH